MLGVAAVLVTAWAVPVQAQPEAGAGRQPVLARFEGRDIDLSADWGEARACLIWRQGGVVECFRTAQALDAFSAQLARERGRPDPTSGDIAAFSLWSCNGALRLFDYSYYGGRQLSFWDRGYWQNLSDYGFDDRTSSYAVGGCYVHLAEHPYGGGWWYPGATYPWAGEPVMWWGWSNVVSSIYIE